MGARKPGHYLQSIHLTLLLASTVIDWGWESTHPSLPSLTPLNLLILYLPHYFLWQQMPCYVKKAPSIIPFKCISHSFPYVSPHSRIVDFFKPQSNCFSPQCSIYNVYLVRERNIMPCKEPQHSSLEVQRKASLKHRPGVYELSPLVCSLCILSALCTGHCKELRLVQFFVLAAQLYVLLLATPKVHTRCWS